MNQGKASVVKHMLAIDWKFWKSYIQTSSASSITIRMLGRLSALRELFKAKVGECSSSGSSGELIRGRRFHKFDEDNIEAQTRLEIGKHKEGTEVVKAPSEHASLTGLNDASDEFFDVPEPLDLDQSDNGWASDFGLEMCSQDTRHTKVSLAAVLVKKVHVIADGAKQIPPLL